MAKINWQQIHSIHFVGIGGVGMSALARLLFADGKQVSGSDAAASPVTAALVKAGIKLTIGQSPKHLPADTDLIIYSDAVPPDNPERQAAQARGTPELSYFSALGTIANLYYLVAVAGTHGKTTTTAMLIDIFEAAGLDPTAVVGSLRTKSGSNFRAGASKYFIVEADEYRRHFLNFTPDMLVITNLEADHLDYYKDLDDIKAAFASLITQLRPGGTIITDSQNPTITPLLKTGKHKVIDYNQYMDGSLKLKVPGRHNLLNAAAAAATAQAAGIPKPVISRALNEFSGTWRRFEYKGESPAGAKVYDDYAHHPAEVKATIAAARELFPNKKLVVAFQPHLYSRTKLLFADFTKALAAADELWLAPIFAAREKFDSTITHSMLAQAISKAGTPAQATSLEEMAAAGKKLADNAVLITMGAGELYKVAEQIVED